MRESRGERRGVVQGVERGGEGRQASEQVAWRGGRARVPVTRLANWRQEDDGGGGLGWLAGPASWLGRTGKFFPFFLFLFLFNISATLLNLIKYLGNFKNSPNYSWPIVGLFPT